MSARFDRLVSRLFDLEGGYVNRKSDPGGETKFGISRRQYPTLDIASLTREQAAEIYKKNYWRPELDELASEELASEIFEASVNCGPYNGAIFLQQALNALGCAVIPDGRLGPHTVKAANAYQHPDSLLMALRIEIGAFYRSLSQPKNYAGWLKRLK